MNVKETLGKFGKGFLSGGGAALLAFFAAQGCSVTSLKEFSAAAGIAVVSGGFHALVNMYNQSKSS